MIAPTNIQLFDEDGVQPVHSSNTHWRHGTYESVVFFREADATHWCAKFRLSLDGETNELRDGGATITQVKPVEKTVTVYVQIEAGAQRSGAST